MQEPGGNLRSLNITHTGGMNVSQRLLTMNDWQLLLCFTDWILSKMTHPRLRPLPGGSHEWWSDWLCSLVSALPSSGHQNTDPHPRSWTRWLYCSKASQLCFEYMRLSFKLTLDVILTRPRSSHSLSKAHHVVADVEGGVELTHEDLAQDPGARSKPCPAPRAKLRRRQTTDQLYHHK